MSSEISKTELCKQRDQKILKKTRVSQRRAFKRRKESNSNHIRELDRQAFAKSKKSNPQHVREVNRNAQNRSLMSGLNPTDHALLQPATKRASCTPVNEIQEIECKNSKQDRRCKKWQKSLKLFMITLSVVLSICTYCDQVWYLSSVM